MLKKLGLAFSISILIILLCSCGAKMKEFSPGNFAGFTLPNFMDVSTRIELDAVIDNFSIDGVMLEKILAQGTNSLSIRVVKFEKTGFANTFWYSWARNRSGDLEAIFSTIPWIYGELKGEFNSVYYHAWFSGQWFYLFEGDKSSVSKAVKGFKDYTKIVVDSVES